MKGGWRRSAFPVVLLLGLGVASLGVPGAGEGKVPAPETGLQDPWETLTALPPDLPDPGAVRIHVPGDPVLAPRLRVVHREGREAQADRFARVLGRNPDLPGLPPGNPGPVVLVLASTEADWEGWTGGTVPHWGAGVAIPARRLMVLPLFRAPWSGGISEDRTLRHEWAHLGLHGYLQGLRIPRWFDEGYAQWASGGWDAASAWRLRVALARGESTPLSDLTLDWPADRARAELAYLLSASAVGYLVELSGTRGMEVFLERWREDGNFDGAFFTTFGFTPGVFEIRWAEHVRDRYGWLVFLSQTGFIWGVLGILLLGLVALRRRRNQERLERLRAMEEEGGGGEAPGTGPGVPGEGGWWDPLPPAGPRRPRPSDAPVDPPTDSG